jgi:hypothetical protein
VASLFLLRKPQQCRSQAVIFQVAAFWRELPSAER